MTPDLKVAVLGFGLAGRVFHAPFVSAVPGLHLNTILQRTGDDAARAYPGVHIARSLDEVLADPAIDLVVVGTPNETHFPIAKAALEAGKHVVVDKPLAPTSEEIRTLARVAATKGRVLAPFHNRRWDGDFLTVRQLLADHTLGRVVTFSSRFDRFRPALRPGAGWKEAADPSHGVLFDLGPHLIDQALALFGTPTHLTASTRHEREGTEIDDAFDIVLDFPAPAPRVLLGATAIAADPAPRFHLDGTQGSYRKFGVDPQEPTLVAGGHVPRLGSPEVWLRESPDHFGTLTIAPDPVDNPKDLNRTTLETQPGDYRLFYANVLAAIRHTAPLAVLPRDAWRAVRLLELARQSSAEQRTLSVDLTPGDSLLK